MNQTISTTYLQHIMGGATSRKGNPIINLRGEGGPKNVAILFFPLPLENFLDVFLKQLHGCTRTNFILNFSKSYLRCNCRCKGGAVRCKSGAISESLGILAPIVFILFTSGLSLVGATGQLEMSQGSRFYRFHRLYSFKKDRFFITILKGFYKGFKGMMGLCLIECCRGYLLGVPLVRAWNRRKTDGIDRIMTLLRSLNLKKEINRIECALSLRYQLVIYVNIITQLLIFHCSIISNKLKPLIISTYGELYIIYPNRPFRVSLFIYQTVINVIALFFVKIERLFQIVNPLTFQWFQAPPPQKICVFFATPAPITAYKLESYLKVFHFLVYRYGFVGFKCRVNGFFDFQKVGGRGECRI